MGRAVLGLGLLLAAPAPLFAAPTAPEALAGCGAATLGSAVECLAARLSDEDQAALKAGARTSSTRGRIDALVRRHVLAEGTGSPLSRWLSERGIDHPQLQSATLIDSFVAAGAGRRLDLKAMAGLDDKMPPPIPLEQLERMLGLPTPQAPHPSPAGDEDAD